MNRPGPRVVKIGGAALVDPAWLTSFAAAVRAAQAPLVVVHGGGPDITSLSDRLGVGVSWHEGRRVTPPEALDIASMVLNGRVNKSVVAALINAGVDAVGLSGIDGGLIRAELSEGGMLGRVGHVVSIRTALLHGLLDAGHTVVVSPISLGTDGGALNVNADDAAAAIASALNAAELVFLTDVPGVLEDGDVRPWLRADEASRLVTSGVARGGMSVKLRAAMKALETGVAAVRIGDASVLVDRNAGTALRAAALGVA